MAHEMMHVKHRDILIGSVAAAIATAISFVAQMAMWSAMFGGRDATTRTATRSACSPSRCSPRSPPR